MHGVARSYAGAFSGLLRATLSGKPVTLFADPQPGERRFDRATGIAVDERGNVFVAENRDRSVRRLGPNGQETTIARLPFFWSPTGLGRSSCGDLYVVANLRFPTPGFLAGLVGNPSVFQITTGGRVRAVAPARGRQVGAEPVRRARSGPAEANP